MKFNEYIEMKNISPGTQIVTEDGELMHAGVMGMRWGFGPFSKSRRTAKGSKNRNRKKHKYATNKSNVIRGKAITKKNKKISEMSDKELEAKTKRMNAEKNYMEARKSLAKAGKSKVATMLEDAVMNSAKAVVERQLKDAGMRMIDNYFGSTLKSSKSSKTGPTRYEWGLGKEESNG